MRERETVTEKNWRARLQLLACGLNAVLVCGPKAIFTLSSPLLLAIPVEMYSDIALCVQLTLNV